MTHAERSSKTPYGCFCHICLTNPHQYRDYVLRTKDPNSHGFLVKFPAKSDDQAIELALVYEPLGLGVELVLVEVESCRIIDSYTSCR